MTSQDLSLHRKVHVLASYLGPEVDGRHRDLVREELADLLKGATIPEQVLRTIFCLGDPGLIDLVLERAGTERAVDLTDLDGDRIDVFDIVDLANMRPDHRVPAFERLKPLSSRNDLDLASKLMHHAMRAGDTVLAEHLLDVFDEVDRHVAYLETRLVAESHPGFAPIWREIIEHLDLSRGEVGEFARAAVRQQNARAVALLMKRGYPIKPLIATHRIGGGPWPERMRQRIDSAHGEMALHASLPSLEEIAALPEKDVQVLLGGLSRKQKKKKDLEQQRKKREHQERRAAQGKLEDRDEVIIPLTHQPLHFVV